MNRHLHQQQLVFFREVKYYIQDISEKQILKTIFLQTKILYMNGEVFQKLLPG